MGDPGLAMRYHRSVNRVAKWRLILAGRVWGTEKKTPQAKGRTDIFEKLILLRVEVSALTQLLIKKGVFTQEELMEQIIEECDHLDLSYSNQFPGIRATEDGIEMYDVEKATETMKGWPK